MGKRPTPKKRRAKSDGGHHYGAYVEKQLKKLRNKQNSPYAAVAEPKDKGEKAITKIAA